MPVGLLWVLATKNTARRNFVSFLLRDLFVTHSQNSEWAILNLLQPSVDNLVEQKTHCHLRLDLDCAGSKCH